MAKGVPRSTSSITSMARDIGGVGTALVLGSVFGEIGSIVSIFLAPKVAKSSNGQNFSQGIAYLVLLDNLFSRFLGVEAI